MTDQKANDILKKDPGQYDNKLTTEQTDGKIDEECDDEAGNHQKMNKDQVSSRNSNKLKEVAQKDPTNDQVELVEKGKDICEV